MATNDVKLNIKYGEKGGLPTAKTNGTLYVAKKEIDNKAELHVDLDGTRYLISDALTADNTLNSTSENAVQNKVINAKFSEVEVELNKKAPKETGIYYIAGTGSTEGTWLGSDDRITSLYTGLTIAYKIPIKGGSSTTTLNINNWGAKTVYYNTTKLTTQYPINTIVILTYDGTYWKTADYNTDTKVKQNAAITTNGDYPIILGYNTNVETAVTDVVNKSKDLTYNPGTQTLSAPNFKGAFKGTFDGVASEALYAKEAGEATTLTGLSATIEELNYSDGVTSNIQTQLNSKSVKGHVHKVTHKPTGTVSSSFTGKAVTSGKPSATVTVASDEHTHTFIPSGTISAPQFTGAQGTATASYKPAGTVSQPTFTGSETTLSVEYTPSGTVSKPTFTGSEVTTSNISGTTNIYSITGVGSLPSSTHSSSVLGMDVSNKCLTISFTQDTFTFNPGTLPTRSSAISVATGSHTHKVTPAGTVSQPSFGGTKATIEIDYTPSGTISQPTFSGTQATISSSFTPKGSISAPTFTGNTGTTESITGTVSVAGNEHTHSVTASGTVGSAFTGTEATLTTTGDQ